MPHLSPQTLTQAEQRAILRATARNSRDHLIYSLALGTGLRLAEIVGLNVGDVYGQDGKPKNRLRLRPEIAKGGRSGDVFLPDAFAITNVYRRSRDLYLAQRFARHASPLTTTIYTHPSDEDLYAGIRHLPC
jgi:integrase